MRRSRLDPRPLLRASEIRASDTQPKQLASPHSAAPKSEGRAREPPREEFIGPRRLVLRHHVAALLDGEEREVVRGRRIARDVASWHGAHQPRPPRLQLRVALLLGESLDPIGIGVVRHTGVDVAIVDEPVCVTDVTDVTSPL